MRRGARVALVGAGVLLALWGGGSLDLRPGRTGRVAGLSPADGPLRLEGPMWAGAAQVDVTPSGPVPLGGFGSRKGARFTEVRDPVYARALVLGADGHRLAVVGLDVVLVPPPLAEAIRARVRRLGVDEVVVLASHTHNGPGGLWDLALAEAIGLGAFDPAYTEQVVAGAAAAVARADAGAVPATVSVGEGPGPDRCRSRVPGRTPDRRLTEVRLTRRDDGGVLGRLVVFACHPTLLGAKDHRLSAEWPGALARRLPGVTVVAQGAVGDVTARRREGPEADLEALAAAVAKALPPPRPVDAIAFRAAAVDLPDATGDTIAPPGLRALAGNLLARTAPRRARVEVLRVGPEVLALVPAEVVSPLGRAWAEALAGPGETARVVSLSGGYLGYLETAEALARRGGESHEAFYGPDAVGLLEAGLKAAAGHRPTGGAGGAD